MDFEIRIKCENHNISYALNGAKVAPSEMLGVLEVVKGIILNNALNNNQTKENETV